MKSTRTKSKLPQFTGDLEEHLEMLLEFQEECEKNGKYLDAEMTKKKIMEVKEQLDKTSKSEMKQRHNLEREAIQKTFQEELNNFESYWNEKINEYESEVLNVEDEAIERHKRELETYEQQLDQELPTAPKQTAELLNLKRIESELVKQKEFDCSNKDI